MPAKKSKVKRLKIFIYWFAPLVFVLGVGSGYLLRSLIKSGQSTADDGVQRYNIVTGDAPSIGPMNAPVTIVEFGDYQCGYCRTWHSEVFGQLMAMYSGKIRFVYINFPLASQTIPPMVAASCADQQGKYWEYHSALFTAQYGYDTQALMQYASDLSLNTGTFSQCLESTQVQQEIMDSYSYAGSLGVQSTPTFFINGIPLVGAQPLAQFKSIIDSELDK